MALEISAPRTPRWYVMAMTDGIPTLADALAGKPIDSGSSTRANGRVHRLDDRPVRPLPEPAKPPGIKTRTSNDRAVLPHVEIAPFPPMPPLPKYETTNETEEETMPKGIYDRANRTAAARAKKTGDAGPPVAASKARRKKGKVAEKKPRESQLGPSSDSGITFSVDDVGCISINGMHLDAGLTKRLEAFLERTKSLRK